MLTSLHVKYMPDVYIPTYYIHPIYTTVYIIYIPYIHPCMLYTSLLYMPTSAIILHTSHSISTDDRDICNMLRDAEITTHYILTYIWYTSLIHIWAFVHILYASHNMSTDDKIFRNLRRKKFSTMLNRKMTDTQVKMCRTPTTLQGYIQYVDRRWDFSARVMRVRVHDVCMHVGDVCCSVCCRVCCSVCCSMCVHDVCMHVGDRIWSPVWQMCMYL